MTSRFSSPPSARTPTGLRLRPLAVPALLAASVLAHATLASAQPGAAAAVPAASGAGGAHLASSYRGVRLSEILARARESDAQFAAARATAAAGREKLPQAMAGLLPNVNVVLGARNNRDGSSPYPGALNYDSTSAALSVNQPLFRLANVAGAEQAKVLVQIAERQLVLAEQELYLRVARGYFDVLQAQDDLAAATAQKDALVQQLAQARRSFEVGTVPVTDLNEAQSRHDLAVAQEIAARNEVENKKRVLERIIGGPLPRLARLGAKAEVDVLPDREQDALAAAAPREGHPVVIARMAVDAAEIELRRRGAGHLPTVDIVGALRADNGVNARTGAAGLNGGLNNTTQATLGLELTFPVYQGGAISSRQREGLADLTRAREELTNAERQAQLDASQAMLGVQSGSALTRALSQALRSSETQVRSTQRGLDVGLRSRVDVLNAEQQLFVTRKDLAAARYRTLVSSLQLRAAAGALSEADLRALDALLTD